MLVKVSGDTIVQLIWRRASGFIRLNSSNCEGEQGGHMKAAHIMAPAVLIVASAFGLGVTQAQQAGTKRTDLQRRDLSAPGREVVQVRVDFDPGYVAPRHTHPGEEIIYVIEGSLEYEIDGKISKVKAGQAAPHRGQVTGLGGRQDRTSDEVG
jgi:anti-sigma factor ChrR (cupin superfamily)